MADALDRLFDTLEPKARRNINRAIKRVGSKVTTGMITESVRRGRVSSRLSAALNTLPDELRASVGPIIDTAVAQGGAASLRTIKAGVRFDITNPLATKAAGTITANLVKQVTVETKKSLRTVIQQAFRDRLPPAATARRIKPLIGLTSRQAVAVRNFRSRLASLGLDEKLVTKRAARYAEKLLRQRAFLIARTETIRALSAGQQAAWRTARNAGRIPKTSLQRWSVVGDDRLCPICIALSGVKRKIGQQFPGGISHPPAHPACVIGPTAVWSRGLPKAVTNRVYQGDIYVIQAAALSPLTITPNHPVLTRRGWVSPHSLVPGDQIACDARWGERHTALIDGDEDHVPSRIEQVSRAVAESLTMASVEVPTAGEDFHGDGIEGQVSVVRTDSALRRHASVERDEMGSDVDFVLAGVGEGAFDSFGDLHAMGDRLGRSERGGVSGGDLAGPLCRRHAAPLDEFSVSASANGNLLLDEAKPDDLPTNAESVGQSLFRDAGSVVFRDLIHVERYSVHGVPVYNLETNEGSYVAEGHIIHNCRCTLVLETRKRRRA